MKIIEPYFEIETYIDGHAMLKRIESAGRTCYKSECKIGPGTAPDFVRRILSRHHESVIEHESVTVRFICDRGVSHEIVRHRLCSFSQESTRYCNYGKSGEVVFIKPLWLDDQEASHKWMMAMEEAEDAYLCLLRLGWTPQQARSVLPNSLKTEIVMTANLREWRHIFRERTAVAAHPQMRQLMVPLLAEFKKRIPVVFEDVEG